MWAGNIPKTGDLIFLGGSNFLGGGGHFLWGAKCPKTMPTVGSYGGKPLVNPPGLSCAHALTFPPRNTARTRQNAPGCVNLRWPYPRQGRGRKCLKSGVPEKGKRTPSPGIKIQGAAIHADQKASTNKKPDTRPGSVILLVLRNSPYQKAREPWACLRGFPVHRRAKTNSSSVVRVIHLAAVWLGRICSPLQCRRVRCSAWFNPFSKEWLRLAVAAFLPWCSTMGACLGPF